MKFCSGQRTAVLAGILGLWPGAPAVADPPSLWARDCAAAGDGCVLSQSLFSPSQQPLAILRFQLRGDEAVMQALLPAGVHLASGTFYTLDGGTERRLQYLRCRDGLCEASRALTAQEWRALQRGKSLSLLFRPAAGEPPAELQVSLTGITAAAKGDQG
ncbi:invasion associated locus B family protein [Falsigemmobacter faecalis]|uniref:invasion associated locus B family protein n=1 Tax=Falsigemmobacter faecalis TaxID=2488730 RepID=UPI0018F2A05E|nr:invasion associated locus B family protein [Falsigemmobacter faecalis]